MHKVQLIWIFSINIVVALSLTTQLNVNSFVNKSDNISIDTLNNAINSLSIDKNGIYNAFVTSDDRIRNIILKQTIKPDRRNFFGLIIIPCKSRDVLFF